jgi:phosphonate transport system ATP-binding protein
MIEFRTLSKAWPDGTLALQGIHLQIPKGQFCVILGPSGAGKSTLLRTVNGLVKPSQGEVWIDQQALETKNEKALRQRVSMVHQHFNLSPRLSVAANVLSGLLPAVSTFRALTGWFTPEQRKKACELIEQVGLTPDHLLRRAGDLSGGQQQRVGIARAFMMDPEVVLADEPVASLDPKISEDILTLIQTAAKARGTSVVCSLHQVDLARQFADRIVGMRNGQVVFDGTPEEFNEAMVHRLYHGAQWEDTPKSVEECSPRLSQPRFAAA